MAAPGDLLRDRYRLQRLVSSGGMAAVYEAQDTALARRVAVKVFHGGRPEDRARFDAEAQILARLDHPSLVKVYDAGEHAGDAFVVLEYVDGPTLAQVVADEGALPPERVTALGRDLAGGLAAIHAAGVVHRDVKPGNVLVDPAGRPRLADFGIARLVDTTRLTATGTTLGTAAYMAPEQLDSGAVTTAADVYSLGLVLLEALTGRREFPGTATEAAIARTTRDPRVPADLPAPWPGLLTAMTARHPAQRPSAAEVEAALEDAAEGAITAAVVPWVTATQAVARAPEPPTEGLASTAWMDQPVPPPPSERRGRWAWLVVPLLLTLLLAGAVAALSLLDDDTPDPPETPATTVPATEPASTVPATAPPPTAPPPTEATTTTGAPVTAPTTTEVTVTTLLTDGDGKPGKGGGNRG